MDCTLEYVAQTQRAPNRQNACRRPEALGEWLLISEILATRIAGTGKADEFNCTVTDFRRRACSHRSLAKVIVRARLHAAKLVRWNLLAAAVFGPRN